MKLRKKFYDKFSIVLALAVIFIALPAIAAAQDNIVFESWRDGTAQIFAVNPDGTGDGCNAQVGPPIDKNQCKNGGWEIFNFTRTFVNQGDCINFVKNGGTTSAVSHPGGINVLMGDGSVRFSVEVLKISLPNSPLDYDSVDARDPNAESKARALFDAAFRLRSGLVITVPRDASHVSGRFPEAEFFINDGGDANVLAVELQNVFVSSYQVSSGGTTATAALSLNFTKIEYKTVPIE
jgi:prepilin-type processing-associated H-X9-DG protein